uniref:Uncharacterized protein n=1 Tax=Picea sitchensis TaxID=3332 RepID=A0A6B9XUH6_PICSI|nr:hypothetical protein Q903MT_gene5809 [Picea sitchensis]
MDLKLLPSLLYPLLALFADCVLRRPVPRCTSPLAVRWRLKLHSQLTHRAYYSVYSLKR